MVPKSKRVAQSQGDALKASVENILSDISVSSALDQPLYADDIKVSSFDVYDGSLIVNLNKMCIRDSPLSAEQAIVPLFDAL